MNGMYEHWYMIYTTGEFNDRTANKKENKRATKVLVDRTMGLLSDKRKFDTRNNNTTVNNINNINNNVDTKLSQDFFESLCGVAIDIDTNDLIRCAVE